MTKAEAGECDHLPAFILWRMKNILHIQDFSLLRNLQKYHFNPLENSSLHQGHLILIALLWQLREMITEFLEEVFKFRFFSLIACTATNVADSLRTREWLFHNPHSSITTCTKNKEVKKKIKVNKRNLAKTLRKTLHSTLAIPVTSAWSWRFCPS